MPRTSLSRTHHELHSVQLYRPMSGSCTSRTVLLQGTANIPAKNRALMEYLDGISVQVG